MKGTDCTVVVRNLINKHALTRCPVHLFLRVNKGITLCYPLLHEEQARALKPEQMVEGEGEANMRKKPQTSCGRDVENRGDLD